MKVRIRKTTAEDSDYIFNLVSEPTTREVSFNQKVITREQHDIWLSEIINSNSILFFIIESKCTEEAIGQLRVNKEGTVSLTIEEKHRGLGYAQSSVKELIHYLETSSEFPELDVLYAYIRERNVRSSKTFLHVGFKKSGIKNLYGHECIIHSLALNRTIQWKQKGGNVNVN